MYKCCDCGYVFEEPKEYKEDRTPGYGFESSFMCSYKGCPSCSGNYEEAIMCENCGEYEIELKGEYIDNEWLCEKCLEESEEENE